MKIDIRRLFPSLLLAAGLLGASGLSLLSARSLAWALAGPALLAASVVASRVAASRLPGRSGSNADAYLAAAAVVLAGAIVAVKDPASVPEILPILWICAAVGGGVLRGCAPVPGA